MGKAAIVLGLSTAKIVDWMMYVFDPAAKISEYFDAHDDIPRNGYLDVVWSKH